MGAFPYCENCGGEIKDELEAFIGCLVCGRRQSRFGVEKAIELLLRERKEKGQPCPAFVAATKKGE
jgi:reverse gyrase